MPAPPHTAAHSANLFWLGAVQVLCACTLLAVVMLILLGEANASWWILIVLLFFSPIWAPFAWVLWRLTSSPDDFIVRRDLILVASWAALVLALSSIIFLTLLQDPSGLLSIAISGVIGFLQILLLSSSVKAYSSMPRDRNDIHLLIPRLGGALLLLVVVLFLSVAGLTPKRAADEASAVGSLRTIHAVQIQFAQDHPRNGFATSLAQLGPTPGAELIDSVLASGTKSGYLFAITSAETDSNGRVTGYTATARPIRYGKSTTHSFLIDESGTLHYSTENRAPTLQDPTLM